jgi:hypothetical protein
MHESRGGEDYWNWSGAVVLYGSPLAHSDDSEVGR